MRLEVTPAGVRRAAEAGAVGQPLHAVHGRLVLLLGGADLDLDLDVVTLVGTHDRRDRVTAPAVAVDAVAGVALAVRRRGPVAGRHVAEAGVQLRDRAVAAALQREREVAGFTGRLGTVLAVRTGRVRIEHAQAHRLVAVVDHEHRAVADVDGLGAGTRHVRIGIAGRSRADALGRDHVRERHRLQLQRRIDRLLPGVLHRRARRPW